MSAQIVLAAALAEPGHYEIRDYPLPDPAPGCVLVKMEVSGICGTDKHTYQGYTGQYGGGGTPRRVSFPIIQGHENLGHDRHDRRRRALYGLRRCPAARWGTA
jgi:D-arabinose 1-dehydrogenase-like Zn-dependent alcohol dehydrogenase